MGFLKIHKIKSNTILLVITITLGRFWNVPIFTLQSLYMNDILYSVVYRNDYRIHTEQRPSRRWLVIVFIEGAISIKNEGDQEFLNLVSMICMNIQN